MIGHFNADELADYRAGSISAGRAARISAHLADCADCGQVSSDLDGVASLLASIPVPPMPAQVTTRLEATIAAEAARRAAGAPDLAPDKLSATPPTGTTPARIPGRPDLPRRGAHRARRLGTPGWSSPLLLRGLAAAGVFVLLVGGGVLLVIGQGQRAATQSASGSPAQKQAVPRPVSPNSGVNLGTMQPAAVRYRNASGVAYAAAELSHANYSAANLIAGVHRVIASSPNVASPISNGTHHNALPSATSRSAAHKIGAFSVAQLQSCLATVTDGHPVLLVDVARYLGNPAVIVVLKPVAKTYSVVVAGPACGTAGGDVLRRLSIPQQ